MPVRLFPVKMSVCGEFFNFGKFFGAYGFFTVMLMGAIAATIYIWLMKKHITIKMPDSVPPAVANAFTRIVPAAVALYGVGIINYLFTQFGTTVIEFIAKVLQRTFVKFEVKVTVPC